MIEMPFYVDSQKVVKVQASFVALAQLAVFLVFRFDMKTLRSFAVILAVRLPRLHSLNRSTPPFPN